MINIVALLGELWRLESQDKQRCYEDIHLCTEHVRLVECGQK